MYLQVLNFSLNRATPGQKGGGSFAFLMTYDACNTLLLLTSEKSQPNIFSFVITTFQTKRKSKKANISKMSSKKMTF